MNGKLLVVVSDFPKKNAALVWIIETKWNDHKSLISKVIKNWPIELQYVIAAGPLDYFPIVVVVMLSSADFWDFHAVSK